MGVILEAGLPSKGHAALVAGEGLQPRVHHLLVVQHGPLARVHFVTLIASLACRIFMDRGFIIFNILLFLLHGSELFGLERFDLEPRVLGKLFVIVKVTALKMTNPETQREEEEDGLNSIRPSVMIPLTY